MTEQSIGIVGAGIMGRVLAWQLLQAGYQVSIYDKDPIDSGDAAAFTAAGMLAPYSELESAELDVFQIGQRSLALWPTILTSIGDRNLLKSGGTLVVAHSQDEPDLRQFNQQLQAKTSNDASVKQLDKAELRSLEPQLANRFDRATHLQGESWIYTHEALKRLADFVRNHSNGRWFEESEVSSLASSAITCDGITQHYDCVIDCRGLGAKADIPNLRGVRGELVHVYAPEVTLKHMVRLMHPRYRLYLVPRENHHFILGATQVESNDCSEISVRSALELLSALYSLDSGFAEARILETKTNCRPALIDNLPRIDTEPGLIRVNGLFRHGFLIAPALAERVASILENAKPESTKNTLETEK